MDVTGNGNVPIMDNDNYRVLWKEITSHNVVAFVREIEAMTVSEFEKCLRFAKRNWERDKNCPYASLILVTLRGWFY